MLLCCETRWRILDRTHMDVLDSKGVPEKAGMDCALHYWKIHSTYVHICSLFFPYVCISFVDIHVPYLWTFPTISFDD